VEDNSSKKIPLLYSILFGLKKEYYQPNNIPEKDTMPMRYKEQMMSYPNNTSVTGKQFIDHSEQPKPWIID
jgi:hypothetical protein